MYMLMVIVAVLFSCAVLAFFVRQQSFSLFHPLFFYSAFHFLSFVIMPVLGVIYDYDTIYRVFQFRPTEADRIAALGAAQLGYGVFALFCLQAGKAPFRFKADAFMVEERRRLAQCFFIVGLICGPIAVYSLARYYIDPATYYAGMQRDAATKIVVNASGNGYMMEAQLMLVALSAAIVWIGRFRWYAWIPLGIFVAFRAGTGGRGPFIAALVACVLLYLYECRRKLPGWRMVLVGLAALGLFTVVGEDRGTSVRRAIGMQAEEEYKVGADTKPFETMDFANLQFLEYIVATVPEKTGTYDYFLVNLQVLTEPIPRAWWPGKPIGAPIKTLNLFDHGNPIGMTSSLPGAGWIALGWLGVVIWCGLWGHVLGRVYTAYVRSDQSTLKTLSYMVMLATLVVGYRDGGLLSIVKMNGMYQLPVLVWFLVARRLGIPRLGDVRRRAGRLIGRAGAAAAGAPGGPGRDPLARALPPAVRRRRIALQAAPDTPAG